MSKSLLRRAVVGALLVGAAVTGSGTASAACVGTQQTATACTANRIAYSDCVYAGPGPCKPVAVIAPICVYGHIFSATYQTTTC